MSVTVCSGHTHNRTQQTHIFCSIEPASLSPPPPCSLEENYKRGERGQRGGRSIGGVAVGGGVALPQLGGGGGGAEEGRTRRLVLYQHLLLHGVMSGRHAA